MMRRSEMGVTIALVVIGALAGLAIAGLPGGGGGPDPIAVITDDTDDDANGDDEASDDDEAATTTTTEAETTTTTEPVEVEPPPPVLRPVEEVVVLVANGTTVQGAAGRISDQLAGQGHPTLTPTSTGSREITEIWHVEGYGPDAAALAERLGVPAEQSVPMPPDPGLDPADAHVVVIIGPDLAEAPPGF